MVYVCVIFKPNLGGVQADTGCSIGLFAQPRFHGNNFNTPCQRGGIAFGCKLLLPFSGSFGGSVLVSLFFLVGEPC